MRIPWTNIHIGPDLTGKQNVSREHPEEIKELDKKLQRDRTRRVQQDVGDWRRALNKAEDADYPDRMQLNKIYRDIALDAHLSSVMETRKLQILGKPFMLVDENGEENERATELIQGQWALDLIEIAMDSRFFGPGLVKFGPVRDDEFESIEEVNRDFLLPDFKEMRFDLSQRRGQSLEEEPYDLWMVMIGDPNDMGLLNRVAHPALIKKASVAAWAEYNEVYGIPMAVGKTRQKSAKGRKQFQDMLSKFPETRWALLDLDQDELQVIEPSVGTQATFMDLIEQTNKEISKLIVGQTMTVEDGSSLSQAQVHERVMEGYERADMRYVQTVWNKQILPRMQQLGMIPDRVFFKWDMKEELSLQEKFQFDKTIIQSNDYKLPADYLEQQYGSPVEEKEQPSGPSLPTAQMQDLETFNILNVSFDDYPQEAVENAKKALAVARNERGKASPEALRIGTRIARKEAIGRIGLQTIRKFQADLQQSAVKDADLSDPSVLDHYLVGGDAMVKDYAPKKIQEAEEKEKVAAQTLKVAKGNGGIQ